MDFSEITEEQLDEMKCMRDLQRIKVLLIGFGLHWSARLSRLWTLGTAVYGFAAPNVFHKNFTVDRKI